MPRELIHWHVLEQTVKRLDSEGYSNVTRILSENRAAAYLGALAHDAPYYHRFGFSKFEEVAEALHGKDGENTFSPLHAMLKASTDDSALSAFVLGMISHFVTDIHFHPLVFYFTGNYYASDPKEMLLARTAHRLFETRLDSWAALRFAEWRIEYRTISKILKDLGNQLNSIYDLLDRSIMPSKFSGNSWQQAFAALSLSQSLFVSDLAGLVFRILNMLSLGRLGPIDALFSYGRRRADSRFDGPVRYRNPANGEESQHSISELVESSISECLEIFKNVDSALNSKDLGFSTLLKVEGRSLNVGLIGASSTALKYFSDQRWP